MPPRIAFAGTPEFAVPSLQTLAASGAAIAVVLTQPDRPAGRGRHLAVSPVKKAAEALGLTIAQPASLADRELPAAWRAGGSGPRSDLPADRRAELAPDLLLVVAYGLLLPQWMLQWPRLGCVNLHASLLPRWRGAAPIQQAILAGDASTGVSVMRIEAGLDAGPVYAERSTPIGPDETAASLHDRLAALGAALVAEVLPPILDGTLQPAAQDHARATYAPKIRKADARLDWLESAPALARRVRAFNPWPGAFTCTDDGRAFRVWRAEARPAEARPAEARPAEARPAEARRYRPGEIVAAGREGIDVAAGEGVLRLQQIQPSSSTRMDASAYLAAHSLDGTAFV